MSRLIFRKTTPEGLSVDVEDIDGAPILLLTQAHSERQTRYAQILGIAGPEVNTTGESWYYEYSPIERGMGATKMIAKLKGLGYEVGVFDQWGKFTRKMGT